MRQYLTIYVFIMIFKHSMIDSPSKLYHKWYGEWDCVDVRKASDFIQPDITLTHN